jgi:hypothetical protein
MRVTIHHDASYRHRLNPTAACRACVSGACLRRPASGLNPVEQRVVEDAISQPDDLLKDVGDADAPAVIIINQPPRDYRMEIGLAFIGAIGIVLGATVPVIIRLQCEKKKWLQQQNNSP